MTVDVPYTTRDGEAAYPALDATLKSRPRTDRVPFDRTNRLAGHIVVPSTCHFSSKFIKLTARCKQNASLRQFTCW